MTDSIRAISQRLQLATARPEMLDTVNRAAVHWRDDVLTLLAEVERLQRVVVAARAARAATGNYNLHRAECGQSCDICDGLADIELDAANELDMELAQAASAR